MTDSIETRVARLQQPGVVDMHFDMLMDLYEKRDRTGVLNTDYLPELEAGGIGVLGVAIYIEDQYLPEMGLRVALDQIARLYSEVEVSPRFAICRSSAEIAAARAANKIALLITLEGVEPLGADLNLLRVFYELGLRSVGLTHARRNMAGDGGIFAPSGSSRHGLTSFGKEVVKECEALGIMVDLAHLNPVGIDDVLAMTTRPPIYSHINPRAFFDIERNASDDHIRAVGQRGGIVGVNAALISPPGTAATLDRYIDNIDYVIELVGMDNVGIGFDFFEFIYKQMSPKAQAEMDANLAPLSLIPDLVNHAHAPNLTRRLIERGYRDDDIEKILYKNWLRIFKELLP